MVRHRPDALWTMAPPEPEVFVKPTVKADEAAVHESSTVVAPAVVALPLIPTQNGVSGCSDWITPRVCPGFGRGCRSSQNSLLRLCWPHSNAQTVDPSPVR